MRVTPDSRTRSATSAASTRTGAGYCSSSRVSSIRELPCNRISDILRLMQGVVKEISDISRSRTYRRPRMRANPCQERGFSTYC
ncbi:hypothetical protein ACFPRL_17665 [Pseudoclavibacter helvolus]